MEEYRIDAEVECTDGSAGEVYALLIDPVKQSVTHIVVKVKSHLLDIEKIVPVERIQTATHDLVTLDCTVEEFQNLDSFIQSRYVESQDPSYLNMEAGAYMYPYATSDGMGIVDISIEQIPQGELAIHRGARVEATDGHIGHVGEFIVDPETSHVTHVVLEKGHLWAKREIAVPIGDVESVSDDLVRVKMDKASIKALPEPSLTRHYE